MDDLNYMPSNQKPRIETDTPFGRQPTPVTVRISGSSQIDVDYWFRELCQKIEFKGDQVQPLSSSTFKIYPRAVND